MKVSIIGGGGRVGADAAYALQLGGIVREIALVDLNGEMAEGEALDLCHGSSLTSNQLFYGSHDFGIVEGSDCVVITSGIRRRPDETRLELVSRNVSMFRSILEKLSGVHLNEGATLVVVSNPVDVHAYLASEAGLVPPKHVIGVGTLLDTCRFQSLLATHFKVNATDVKALILGEHGDTMVPILSSATLCGVPLRSIPNFDQEIGSVFEQTRRSGAEVIRLKGGAGRAVGIAIKQIVEAIALDSERVLPVSSLQSGVLGISDISLSMPTKVGKNGVVEVLEPFINESEREGLHRSAQVIREVLAQIS